MCDNTCGSFFSFAQPAGRWSQSAFEHPPEQLHIIRKARIDGH